MAHESNLAVIDSINKASTGDTESSKSNKVTVDFGNYEDAVRTKFVLKEYQKLKNDLIYARRKKWTSIFLGLGGLAIFTPLVLKGNTSGSMGSGYVIVFSWMGEIASAGSLLYGITTSSIDDKKSELKLFVQKNF